MANAISSALFSPIGAAVLSLPPSLEKMRVQLEEWILGDFDLSRIDLNNPSLQDLTQIVGSDISQLKRLEEFKTPGGAIDIVSLSPETPGLDGLLDKFSRPHDHSDPEIRLILDGEGMFTLWDEEGTAFEIRVTKGTFLVVPAGALHTFELTEKQTIVALRVFQTKEGWVPNYRSFGSPN